MYKNQKNCHSEPNSQRLTREESQRSCSQNDTALVGANSISARQRGITLVALVVTIVVLLILAGITINFAISEGGIIAKANQAKEKQEIGQLKDQINLNVVDWYTDRILNDNITIDDLWNKLIQDKIIADAKTDVEGPDANGVYLVTTNKGYVIEVIIDDKGNVTIGEGGKKDELPPRIVEFKSTSKTPSSIAVKAEVTRIEEGGKLSYYYKKSSETEYKALKENTTDKTAEYTGLIQNIAYDLKLVAKNKNGSVEQKISVLTGELASGTISQKGETTWSAGTASVELQTTDTVNTMQYQKNGIAGTWVNYTAAITGLMHGDVVYARMFDGVNGTSPYSIGIMDGVAPTVTITNSSNTTNSVTVTASSTDAQSGMLASPTYTFYRKVSTEADSSYIKDQESTSNSYTKTGLLQNTTYTIKIETKDKANNIGSVTKNITTSGVGGATGGLTTGNVIASIPTWSAGTASITLSTSTGFTLQWQKNAINGTWTNYTGAIAGLLYQDTVYARLTDGTNYGDSASVSILDGEIPQSATINLSKTTTYTATPITGTVTQIDNESGADITKCKWVYNTTAGAIGTAESSYTGGTFSSNPQTITLNASTAGTYYLHVLTIDKAGNKKESISGAITVKQPTIADIKAGDYVAYTGGGYSSWRVLWEVNNSTAGNGNSIQIISTGKVKDVTLGNSSDFNASKNSYNSAITTLNSEAMAYVNSTYASDARCVGSVPNNKNAEATTYFTSSYSYMSPYNGQFKNADTNYEKDWNKMTTLGIQNMVSDDWLASRIIYSHPANMGFHVRYVVSGGGLSSDYLSIVHSFNDANGCSFANGLRPVVSLKSNIKITGGDGSEGSPWQIGI